VFRVSRFVLCLRFVLRALADCSQDLEIENRKIYFLRFVSVLFYARSPSYHELSGLKKKYCFLHLYCFAVRVCFGFQCVSLFCFSMSVLGFDVRCLV